MTEEHATTPLPSRSVIDEVTELRRHFHRHPEVSFSEHETSRQLSERLRQLGLEIKPCPTETGVVAMLDTGKPGKTVMLRADIDGLPIHEESGVDFASRTDGRMHACGHDAHMAIMVGVARTLVDRIWDINGRYLFVFQPAEEIVEGAKAMIAKGLLDNHHPDSVIGLHVASFLESGTVVSRPGLMWAGSDAFEIGFAGPGGHGGMMGRRGNVLAAQAFFIERLHTIVEGLEQDGVQCHTTVGDIRSDGAWNIVPRGVLVKGSLRTFNAPLREEALGRLRDLLRETDSEFEVHSSLDLVHGTVPLMNEPNVTKTVLDVGRSLIGDQASVLGRPLTVSDDFAEFLTRIPGCYFMLGAMPKGAPPPAHHSPGFRIDEDALAIGVKVLAGAASRLAAD
ncbi:MAG TPA: M20 family metallopeptidase [Candidatus Acidoferrum sp.]|nr:M20 family metallopeptidase [Candidatus Angelobacter sp.]HXD82518.1 M20 family metallopeptidase [Candidatus Acidoferrum sp.]